MSKTIQINGVEYEIFDQNITSDEVAFSAFSGYMAFNGELPKRVLETMADNYEKAINAKVVAGEITEEVGKNMIKKYGSAVMKLVGQRINNIFQITDGVITAVFDKNMNPDKSLDDVIVPRFLEYGISWAMGEAGFWIGGAIGGPVGGVIGGVAGAVLGAIIGGINADDWYMQIKPIVVDKFGMTFEFMDTTIYGKITQKEFMLQELEQNNQTTKDFCVRMYPKFARYVQTYDLNKIDINASNFMAYINKISYDKVKQNLTIQTQNEVDSVSEAKEISQIIAETTKVQTLTINSQTYNIKELSNLQILNAIENIPQVSFLLSHILIKVGEYLDLGEKGIYKIKSGDTLSVIAQKNGMVTKDLVRLNSWLCDEGRISFNQNKVLIEGNPLNLSNTNYTLYGEANAENVLIDANGGDSIEFINLSLVA